MSATSAAKSTFPFEPEKKSNYERREGVHGSQWTGEGFQKKNAWSQMKLKATTTNLFEEPHSQFRANFSKINSKPRRYCSATSKITRKQYRNTVRVTDGLSEVKWPVLSRRTNWIIAHKRFHQFLCKELFSGVSKTSMHFDLPFSVTGSSSSSSVVARCVV